MPAEQRGVGALDSDEAADGAAGRYVNVDGLRNTLREQLRTYHEQTGRAPLVGDGTAVFWRPKPDGSGRRDFGVFPVEDIPAPPPEQDIPALLEESLAQAREGRA